MPTFVIKMAQYCCADCRRDGLYATCELVSAAKSFRINPDDTTFFESQIEQETFAFLWTLKNYSAFNSSEEIKSPSFRGGPKSNHHW